jgi:ankyrin repeat protein
MLCICLGLCEIVEALLSKGANIDALTLGGTALHCACNNGRDGVVKILLDHHADVSVST